MSVVHVGNVRDDLCLHYELIVLRGEQCHLCRTLLVEKVAEEVDVPRCGDRQRVGLRSGVAVPRSDGALRREGEAGHEGELSHHELVLHHFHVERGVEHVGVVLQAKLDERLQLWVGEHGAPSEIAEACGVAYCECVALALHVAHEARGVHLRTLVLIIYSAAGHQQCASGEKH